MAPENIEKEEITPEETDKTAELTAASTDEASEKTEAAAEAPTEETVTTAKGGLSKLAIAVIVALAAVILTTVILLIALLGGSGAPYTAEDIGLYSAVAAEKNDMTIDITGLFAQGFSIELNSRGKCKINLNGDIVNGKWSCVDNSISVSGGGVSYTGRVADGVMQFEDVMNEDISLTLMTSTAADELPSERTGKYYITSFDVNGQTYDGDMLESAGFDGWYIQLEENGSGEALMFSSEVTPLLWSSASICCSNGQIISYSYEDGVISLDYAGMSAVTFKNDDALNPFSEEGLAGELTTDVLECGSLWSGTLSVTGHEGEGAISDGVTPVYGFLCKDSAGGSFFEIYKSSTRSGDALMSYWVEIDGDTLMPVIGELDGWIFDYWLTANDKDAFTLHLKDSSLELIYLYNYMDETCSVNINLKYAGTEG